MDFKIAFLFWFSASISLTIAAQFLLVLYLKRNGVPFKNLYVGVPSYLDGVYADWCRENGRDYRLVIVIRRIWLLNVIAVVLVSMFAQRNNLF